MKDRAFSSRYGDPFGAFEMPFRGLLLRCIVSSTNYKDEGMGPEYAWEHVSVSLKNLTPSWEARDYVKDVFWKEDETVVQFHVPKSEHVNIHPNLLLLWRPLLATLPRPPAGAV